MLDKLEALEAAIRMSKKKRGQVAGITLWRAQMFEGDTPPETIDFTVDPEGQLGEGVYFWMEEELAYAWPKQNHASFAVYQVDIRRRGLEPWSVVEAPRNPVSENNWGAYLDKLMDMGGDIIVGPLFDLMGTDQVVIREEAWNEMNDPEFVTIRLRSRVQEP